MKKNLLPLTAIAGALFATGAFAVTATYTGTGTPIAIPDNGSVPVTATAPGPAATTNITDLNLTFNVTHTWAGDIGIALASSNPVVPSTSLVSCTGTGQSGDYTGVNVTLDDAAAAPFVPCPGTANITGGTFQSAVSPTRMAVFNGSATAAPMTWTLTASDDSAICTGTLNSFSVTVTSDAALPVELSKFSID